MSAPPQKKLGFVENFMLSGAAAVISKTAAAPIERVKLLVQNQAEMLKQGKISEPYKGVVDCTMKTMKAEGKKNRIKQLIKAIKDLKIDLILIGKVSAHSGEVTWLTASDTSQPRLLTSPSRIRSNLHSKPAKLTAMP